MIESDWAKLRTAEERTIMVARAQTARVIIMCAYTIMGAALFVTVITPFYGVSMRYITNITDPGKYPLPLQGYYIYDITKSPQYEIIFICQTIGMVFCIMPYTGVDNFLGLVIFHISGQLDILRNHVMHLDKIVNFNYALRIHILNHTRLLRYLLYCFYLSILEHLF